MHRKLRWRVLAVVGAVALLAVACGNDSGDDTSADTGADEVEITPGPEVSGEPFNIGVIYSAGVPGNDLPDLEKGALAAATYVNEEQGGIAGRPVEIVSCNEMADPAKAADCGQQFVDENVIGVVGLGPTWGDNGLAIVTDAQIPFVGLPISNAEFITPGSYPFDGGSLTGFPALAKYAQEELGIQSASVLYADLSAGELAANLLVADPLREAGVEATTIPEAPGAADFTSAVVKANENDPDAIFILFSAQDCGRILEAAAQVGVTAQLIGSAACVDPGVVEAVGADTYEGLLVNAGVHYLAQEGEPEFDDAAIFRDRIVRYADQEPTGFSAATFSQVVTLVDVANLVADEQGVDAVSGATVTAEILTLEDQPIFMGTVLNASDPVELGGVPTGVFVSTQRIYEFTDGEFVDIGGGWIDAYA